jgi:predicted NBD/HSP70 family sugar kinase
VRQRIGLNQDDLKRRNRGNVLNTILEKGPICRRDIARHTGLTPATVSNLAAELLACGVVEETGSDHSAASRTGGPNPILLAMASGKPYLLALRLGTEVLEAAVVNLRGRILERERSPLPDGCTAARLLETVGELVARLCHRHALEVQRDCLAVGFSSGTMVAPERGYIVWHHNRAFRGFAIRAELERLLGLPVFLGNASQAMALAEAWFGSGRALENYLFVTAREEIQAAVVLNRSVLIGTRSLSCMLGHGLALADGPLCSCGQHGCLEALAGRAALLRQAEALVAVGQGRLAVLARDSVLSLGLIRTAAWEGDETCRRLLAQRADYLGRAIAGVLNVVDAQAVLLAGCPETPEEQTALETAYRAALRLPNNAPPLVYSQITEDLSLLGAATLVIRQLMSPRLAVTPNVAGKLVASLQAN